LEAKSAAFLASGDPAPADVTLTGRPVQSRGPARGSHPPPTAGSNGRHPAHVSAHEATRWRRPAEGGEARCVAALPAPHPDRPSLTRRPRPARGPPRQRLGGVSARARRGGGGARRRRARGGQAGPRAATARAPCFQCGLSGVRGTVRRRGGSSSATARDGGG
jgi:hypothetical protein